MKKKLLAISMAWMMAFSLLLVGCGGQKSGADRYAGTDPVDGGTITFSMFSAPKGLFNPILYEDQYDANVLQYVFDGLWDYDDHLQISTNRGLAESYEFSDDKKTFTLKLKKGVKWHDGHPLTVDDIIFAWESIADPSYIGVRFSNVSMIQGAEEKKNRKAKTISGITKMDDYTVQVKLSHPIANLLANLWSTPIPKHIYEKMSVADFARSEATTKNIVGSGPFKIKEIRANEYVVLEKNPDYYRGKPHVNQIVLKVLKQDVAIAAIKRGELDILSQLSPKDAISLNGVNDVMVKEFEDFSYQYMGFNLTSPKLKDKKVRQAITYAINRQALVDGLLKGKGYVLNQHIPRASWAYNPDLEKAYPYDVNKAKALLQEAGYKDVNKDGFVEDPSGKPYVLKLDYPTGNPIREDSAYIIAEDLKKAGIRVDLKQPREATAHYSYVQQGKAELYLAGWSLTPDPDPAGIWRSTDPFNYLRYNNPKSDQLITDAVTKPEAFTQEGREKLYHQWTALISEDAPQVFLYGQRQADAYNRRIQGVTTDWRGIVVSDCNQWWIPKDLQ